MRHKEETPIGFEGRKLFFQSWKPEGTPKATIAIVHGGLEHSGHYKYLVDFFWRRASHWLDSTCEDTVGRRGNAVMSWIVEEYVNDPLVLSTNSLRFATEYLKTVAWVRDHPSDWKLPLLMLYGSEENFVSLEDINQFFGDVSCEEKELIIYAGGFHQPHNDLQREQVFSDIEMWIDKRS